MNVQSETSRDNSPALRVAGENAVSVLPDALKVDPQASIPAVSAPGAAAEFVQLPPTGTLASNLMTIEVGIAGVSGLLIRSDCAESDTRPFGVTGQEQHAIICSSGENAYTLAQIAPVVLADVPDAK